MQQRFHLSRQLFGALQNPAALAGVYECDALRQHGLPVLCSNASNGRVAEQSSCGYRQKPAWRRAGRDRELGGRLRVLGHAGLYDRSRGYRDQSARLH